MVSPYYTYTATPPGNQSLMPETKTDFIVNTDAVDRFVAECAVHMDGAGRAWARRHLRRFLLADGRCRVVLRAEHMAAAGAEAAANLEKARRRGLTAVWFEAPAAVADEVAGVLDWIGALPSIDRRLAAKRARIPYEHARAHSERWHRQLARADDGGIEDDPGGIETALDLPGGWRWVRLRTPEALDYEGRRMRHCVGEGSYDRFRTAIYSLRNAAGEPHLTVEFDAQRERIQHTRGRANTELPEKYMGAFTALLELLRPTRLNTRLSEFAIAEDRSILRVSRAAQWPAGTRILYSLVLTNHQDVDTLPEGLHVNGALVLANCSLKALPRHLTVCNALAGLYLSPVEVLPEGLTARVLNLEDSAVKSIAPGTRVLKELNLIHSPVRELPPALVVGELLKLDGRSVRTLPADLEVAGMRVADVIGGEVPEHIVVIGDAKCADLPFYGSESVSVFGRLSAGGWDRLHLPADLHVHGDLDLSGARPQPETGQSRIVVHGDLDLRGTDFGRLPEDWTVHGRILSD